MERLLELLKDGRSRTLEMIAAELGITMEQLERKLEFLERSGIIKRIELSGSGASSCAGCSGCSGGRPARAVCRRAALRIWE